MEKFGLLPRLIVAIVLGIIIGLISPEWVVRVFATFNSVFGSFLGFIIPLIIIGFVAPGIGQLGRGAGKLLGMTAGIAYLSTIIAGLFAYVVGKLLFPSFLRSGTFNLGGSDAEAGLVSTYLEFDIPPMMGVITALVLAFVIGIGISIINGDTLRKFMDDFKDIIEKVISGLIIPLLPIHIFGIFANMAFAGQVFSILAVFGQVFIVIIALHILYLLAMYTVGGSLTNANPFKLVRKMLPAYFTALGTQSSAATIPVTLRQTNTLGVNEGVANFVVPLCATIHLSGSTITIVSCTIAVMMLNGMAFTFGAFIPFLLVLAVTMVAAPGVPGGAIMAALGILGTMLGFDQTLLSLMIALYIAQDSFGTACNVTGDGAIALMVNRFSGHKLTS